MQSWLRAAQLDSARGYATLRKDLSLFADAGYAVDCLAELAQREANKSATERQRAGDLARRQQEEFERLLHNAESETKKAKIRCSVIEKKERIQAGGCPPGDPLCSSLEPGGGLPMSLESAGKSFKR